MPLIHGRWCQPREQNLHKPAAYCLILLLLITGLAHGQFRLDVEKTMFPNGITLLTCVDTTVQTVSYQTFINAGSRDETRAGASGIALMFERMMFSGTEVNPNYRGAIASIGAHSRAFTLKDYTCYSVDAKSESLERVIAIEADRVRNLRLTRDTYRRELVNAEKERKRLIDDDPTGYLYQELYKLAFKRHTYHHPTAGWESDLDKTLTFDDVERFKQIFYAPNYCTIVICGNFDADQVGLWVLERYDGWRKSLPPTTQVRSERQQKKPYRRDLEWKDSLCSKRLLVGYKSPDLNFDTPDLVALEILSYILLSRMDDLSGSLKTGNERMERVTCAIEGRKDPDLFVIDITLEKDQEFDSVIAAVSQELVRIRNDGVTDLELLHAVQEARWDFLFDLSTPFRVGNSLGHYHLTGGDYRMMFTFFDMLGMITSEDIRSVANEYMVPEKSTVVTLSPLTVDESK